MSFLFLSTAIPDKIPLHFIDVLMNFIGELDVLHDMGGDAAKGGFD